nr:hypothetical protein [Streptomyces sp. CC219B]
MHDLICRLAQGLRLLFAPGTGRRRSGAHPAAAQRRVLAHPIAASRPAAPCLLLHRSPHGLDLPLDGAESRLVRPYLTAYERERALQRRRRLALVLAADFGIDLDRHLVGVGEAAA